MCGARAFAQQSLSSNIVDITFEDYAMTGACSFFTLFVSRATPTEKGENKTYTRTSHM